MGKWKYCYCSICGSKFETKKAKAEHKKKYKSKSIP